MARRTVGKLRTVCRTRPTRPTDVDLVSAEEAWAPSELPLPFDGEGVPEATSDFSDGVLGWILPNGDFYPCLYAGHARLAELLWSLRFARPQANPERAAEDAGWLKVMRVSGDYYVYTDERRHRPTPSQRRTVGLWCEANDQELPDWWDA